MLNCQTHSPRPDTRLSRLSQLLSSEDHAIFDTGSELISIDRTKRDHFMIRISSRLGAEHYAVTSDGVTLEGDKHAGLPCRASTVALKLDDALRRIMPREHQLKPGR